MRLGWAVGLGWALGWALGLGVGLGRQGGFLWWALGWALGLGPGVGHWGCLRALGSALGEPWGGSWGVFVPVLGPQGVQATRTAKIAIQNYKESI